MTIEVTISNKDSSRKIEVYAIHYDLNALKQRDESLGALAPGESRTFHVHQTKRLLIVEPTP